MLGDLDPSGVPETFNVSVLHLDDHVRCGKGDKIAIYTESENLSYSKLLSMVNRTGNFLLDMGVRPRQRIMICIPDSPITVANFIAGMKVGAVPFVVSPSLPQSDLQYYITNSECAVVITTASNAEGMRDYGVEKIVTVDEHVDRFRFYQDEIKKFGDELEAFKTRRNDPAYIVYTSGTMGKPNAAVHAHRDLVFTVLSYLKYIINPHDDDIYYTASRLFFSAGRVFSIHHALMSGASVFLDHERPTPERVVKVISERRPTLFLAIPSTYAAIAKKVKSGDLVLDVSSLRLCISGGEPLPSKVYYKWKELTGMDVLNGVGSSEAEWHYISQFPGGVKAESSGRVIPGWDIKLIDANGREIKQPRVTGTLWIRSDSVAKGYLNAQDNTKERFVNGWFNTGDLFYFDQEGYYFFVGRSEDLFKVSGRWVSPSEVEAILVGHHAVLECAVVDYPDQDGLTKAMACIVLREGYGESRELEKELTMMLASSLPPYKVPSKIIFLHDIPKTPNGKVKRYALRQMVTLYRIDETI